MCACTRARTENEDAVPQRLRPVGLHGDVQDGGVSRHDAHAVVLLCLPEHPQQLIGYDAVQGGDGHHGDDEGEERVYLWRK